MNNFTAEESQDMFEMLWRLEWAGSTQGDYCCPICYAFAPETGNKQGHVADCELAALLGISGQRPCEYAVPYLQEVK